MSSKLASFDDDLKGKQNFDDGLAPLTDPPGRRQSSFFPLSRHQSSRALTTIWGPPPTPQIVVKVSFARRQSVRNRRQSSRALTTDFGPPDRLLRPPKPSSKFTKFDDGFGAETQFAAPPQSLIKVRQVQQSSVLLASLSILCV